MVQITRNLLKHADPSVQCYDFSYLIWYNLFQLINYVYFSKFVTFKYFQMFKLSSINFTV